MKILKNEVNDPALKDGACIGRSLNLASIPVLKNGTFRAAVNRGNEIENRIIETLLKMTREEVLNLNKKLKRECIKRHFTYQREGGKEEIINLMPMPIIITNSQLKYLHGICLVVINAIKKLANLYLKDPEVKTILPLTPEEEKLLRDSWSESHKINHPIVPRLDANVDLSTQSGVKSLLFYEGNASAIGGLHYSATGEGIINDILINEIRKRIKIPKLFVNNDTREIQLGEIIAHARAIGRNRPTIALVEDKRWDIGITEMPTISRYFKKKGISAIWADPTEFHIKGNEIYINNKQIDIIYRNFEIRDFFEWQAEGLNVEPIKLAIKRNQIVSSFGGEFDHKSIWEILGSEEFGKYFTNTERKLLKRHIPWTRVLRDIKTIGPDAKTIDLLEFARNNKENLVIKPNRECGGEGVTIGQNTSQTKWERMIENSLKEPSSWIVQKHIQNHKKYFPIISENGKVAIKELYVAYGFITTKSGFGGIGRTSRHAVVNVSRGGGIASLLKIKQAQ